MTFEPLAIEKPKNLFLYLLISRPDLNLPPWWANSEQLKQTF